MRLIQQTKDVLVASFPASGGKVIFKVTNYKPFVLNRTAAEIWDYCKTPRDIETISNYLCKKYGLKWDRAKHDTEKFIFALKKKGLLKNNGRKK